MLHADLVVCRACTLRTTALCACVGIVCLCALFLSTVRHRRHVSVHKSEDIVISGIPVKVPLAQCFFGAYTFNTSLPGLIELFEIRRSDSESYRCCLCCNVCCACKQLHKMQKCNLFVTVNSS